MKTKIFWFEKVKLFGSGHPEIATNENNKFCIVGTSKEVNQFLEDQETTHARFDQVDGRKISKEDRKFIYWNYRCQLSSNLKLEHYLIY